LSDASRKDYVQTLIIPINQSFKADQLSQFAQAYHGKVSPTLPTGEAASQADILIIVGSEGAKASLTPKETPSASPSN